MRKTLLIIGLLSILGACTNTTTLPIPDPPIKEVGAPIEISLTGISSAKPPAQVQPQGLGFDVSNRIILGDAMVRSSTDIVPLGQPRTSGHRYFHVTLPISILEGTFTNLTFMAMNDPKSNQFSAISELARYPGLPAYTQTEFDALANSIEPTSPIRLEPQSLSPVLVRGEEDALQIYTETEVSNLPNTLPYGFVAHTGNSRRIGNVNRANTISTITIAMRVPLQALAKDDPYTIKLRFGIFEDDTTFMTESLQAQQTNNQIAFNAARTRVAGDLRVMPGTTQVDATPICQVRTVGSVSSPTAYLVNRIPTSTIIKTKLLTKGQTLPLEVQATDTNGTYTLPAIGLPNNQTMVTYSAGQLTALDTGTTNISATACDSSSTGTINVLPIKTLSASGSHNLAQKSDDKIIAWGYNSQGQINVPNNLTNVVSIQAGSLHSLAVRTNGQVIAWGNNFSDQSSVPNNVKNVIAIGGGGHHSLALKSDGTVLAWGGNHAGQSTIPTGLTDIIAVSGGYYHSLALSSSGSVAAWGDNTFGQINIPTGLTGVIAISAGGSQNRLSASHSLALKSDGTIVAWGDNSQGQSTIPTGLNSVTAIAAGGTHSLALKSDRTVIAWGENRFGMATVPTGLTDVVAIAAGMFHSIALKSDGSLIAWGYNDAGQINIPNIDPLIFKIP